MTRRGRWGTFPSPAWASCPLWGAAPWCLFQGGVTWGGPGVPQGGQRVCMEGPSCAQHMSPGGPGALSTGTRLGAAGRRLSANKGCSERSVDLLRALGPAGNAETSSPVAYLLPRGGATAGPAPKLSRLWAGGTAPCTPRPVGCLLAPGWPPGFPGLLGEEGKVLTLVTHATVPLPVSAPFSARRCPICPGKSGHPSPRGGLWGDRECLQSRPQGVSPSWPEPGRRRSSCPWPRFLRSPPPPTTRRTLWPAVPST